MSGGSFNYVCFKLDNESEIFKALPDLHDMESYLRNTGKQEAADEILSAILKLETAQRRALMIGKHIKDLAYAVEWWVSGDWDDTGIQTALDKMSGEQQ